MSLFFKKKEPIHHPYMDRCKTDPNFANVVDNCTHLRTRLIIMSYASACSAEEAKYRGRVFSLDGQDKRYPYLSDEVLRCNLACHPFIHGVTSTYDCYGKKYDPIKFSNRPFIDDRTSEERYNYDRLMQDKKKKDDSLSEYLKNKKDYEWICKNLPELAPKTQRGYTRMRNNGSEKFLAIQERAKNMGYII